MTEQSTGPPGKPVTPRPRLTWKKKLLFTSVVLVIVSTLVYSGSVVVRSTLMYNRIKRHTRGWNGHLYTYDPQLGFAPIPNARGSEIFPVGPELPTRFDEHGFRVPATEEAQGTDKHPVVLALGCSFTYGMACTAEETYPYLVAQQLGGACLNAGVCSYGLSQMLIRARELIPRIKPDVVLVQLSPWLVRRSLSPLAPSMFGKLTSPFIIDEPDGGFGLHPPVFATAAFDLPTSKYLSSVKGLGDWLSFLVRVGIPLFVHDDVSMLGYQIRRIVGTIPIAAKNPRRVLVREYGEIAELCLRNGSKMVAVIIEVDCKHHDVTKGLDLPGATIVDTRPALYDRLPAQTKEEYRKAYGHWRGTPTALVDTHPNPLAHSIIAAEVVTALRREQ
ncbi:MAG: hypothetical protein HY292_13325 [Planctomycetes bacterium]|nr:hypothetical protein [Planctomycetota bacterium]